MKRFLPIAFVCCAAIFGTLLWTAAKLSAKPSSASVPLAAPPPGMVLIPAGDFLMGTDDTDADSDIRPQRNVTLDAYYIDRTEVTNAQYRQFKPDYHFPKGEENLPVTSVIYSEAAAYAKWAGKRLPTEDEWEKAARGTDGRRYPWGNIWDVSKVASRNSGKGRPAWTPPNACLANRASRVQSVGTKAAGDSPYGCHDMAGNAWEWVQGFYNNDPKMRILKGGAVGYGETAMRTYNRAVEGDEATCRDTGFRCVKSL